MRTIKINIYEFDELSNEAKEKAIEKERELKQEGWYYDDSNDCLTEDFNERLKELGFDDIKLTWDCSYGQGDYFYIEAGIDLNDKFLEKHKLTAYKELLPHIYACSVKDNEVYVDLDIEIDDEDLGELFEKLVEKKVDNFKEELQMIIDDLSKKFKKEAYEEYEYRLSDECIVEDMENNGGEFEEDGTRA